MWLTLTEAKAHLSCAPEVLKELILQGSVRAVRMQDNTVRLLQEDLSLCQLELDLGGISAVPSLVDRGSIPLEYHGLNGYEIVEAAQGHGDPRVSKNPPKKMLDLHAQRELRLRNRLNHEQMDNAIAALQAQVRALASQVRILTRTQERFVAPPLTEGQCLSLLKSVHEAVTLEKFTLVDLDKWSSALLKLDLEHFRAVMEVSPKLPTEVQKMWSPGPPYSLFMRLAHLIRLEATRLGGQGKLKTIKSRAEESYRHIYSMTLAQSQIQALVGESKMFRLPVGVCATDRFIVGRALAERI